MNHIFNLFEEVGNMLSYEQFMSVHSFPIPLKQFKFDGLELTDRKCDNKHIHQTFKEKKQTIPRGKSF